MINGVLYFRDYANANRGYDLILAFDWAVYGMKRSCRYLLSKFALGLAETRNFIY